MHYPVTTLLAVAFTAVADAKLSGESRAGYAVMDSHIVPAKWSRVSAAPADHTISLNIGLKQSRFEELERQLYEVSDPDHVRYGAHLTADEVNELIKPSHTALESVYQWLYEHGISHDALSHSAAKDWITVVLPVSTVERLLDTEYSVYKHADDASYLVRTPEWSLPRHLHEHVVAIQPTNAFMRTSPMRVTHKPPTKFDTAFAQSIPAPYKPPGSSPDVSKVCNASAVTPDCLRTLYGTIDYKPRVPGLNKVGLNNFLNETNNRSDVSIFLKHYRPEAAGAAYQFKIDIIAGGDNQQTPNTPAQNEAGKDLEGNLDAETIIGIDWPTPLTAYNTGGNPPFKPDINTPTNSNEPYLTWVNYVLAQPQSEIPQVISTSYGDDEQTVPLSYAKQVCKQFAQLGARGVTLLIASGDSGVGGNGTCFSNDGQKTRQFLPSFPPSCPYITVVGATKDFNPEVAAYDSRNGFLSGGGFSNYFPRPAYQDAAVKGYLKTLGSKYKGLYNTSGRAYPDISAQGQHFVTIWNGKVTLLDGTSASTPTASAVLALVNDALLSAKHRPLGFLNPWLYKYGFKAFTDVTSGSSAGCSTAGFPAVKGWDAVCSPVSLL